MNHFNLVLVGLLGLVSGSFLGALTYRLPREISTLKGRSYCPHCRKKIAWYDNVPLFSYLALGGKCRSCSKSISIRYPVIEFVSTVGFILTYILFSKDTISIDFGLEGTSLLVLLLFLFFISLAIFIIDTENMIVPDPLVFLGLGLILFPLITTDSLFSNLFAGFLSASLLFLVHLATSGKGMGLGDVKFALFAGTALGLNFLVPWLFVSFVSGALVGIFLLLTQKATLKAEIPFGPFLAASFLATIYLGDSLVALSTPLL